MARERFSFDDTIEFDKDELKPNNDIHANHTGWLNQKRKSESLKYGMLF